MAFISDSGIGSAARTAGLAILLTLATALTVTVVPTLVSAQDTAPAAARSPGTEVEFAITGARSTRGFIRLCLTSNTRRFPDCTGDAAAHTLSIPASSSTARFEGLAPGTYALSLIHDENGNGRMDTSLGIPREGYGFSRDAAVRFGPPRFSAAAFVVAAVPLHHSVRVRYLL